VESHKKVVIDTNLLVRYLTEDDPQKAKAVEVLLSRAGRGELKILIPSAVIAELVWVLESFYQMETKEISELVEAVLNTPGIEVTEKSVLISAIRLYREKGMDFVDTWITEFAKDKRIKMIYTFDRRHFKDIDGIETRSPI
jgi:predicted nucleic-acid-binding protein